MLEIAYGVAVQFADGVSCLVTWLNDYWNIKESALLIIFYFCLFLFCK
jgi:hypothetical protein